MTLGLRTLVLNADYQPINLVPNPQTIPVEDAITRVYNGTCHVVAEYDRYVKTQNPDLQMKFPSVVARTQMLTRKEEIGFSREFLYYRDHGKCAYSGRPLSLKDSSPDYITIDHVIPQHAGGKTTWDNVVASHSSLNHAKGGSMPVGEWSPKIKPFAPTYWQLAANRRKFPIFIDDPSWMEFLYDWVGEVILRKHPLITPR